MHYVVCGLELIMNIIVTVFELPVKMVINMHLFKTYSTHIGTSDKD